MERVGNYEFDSSRLEAEFGKPIRAVYSPMYGGWYFILHTPSASFEDLSLMRVIGQGCTYLSALECARARFTTTILSCLHYGWLGM